MSTSRIEFSLQESRHFEPSELFQRRARLGPEDAERLRREAAADPISFWGDQARRVLTWDQPFTTILDDSEAPTYQWFTDGTLNVSTNCLDRHLDEAGDRPAIVFEGEPGDTRTLTYRALHHEVCRFANALRDQGVEMGDRVVIYMPMVPEAVIAMQACTRIGAIHSVVFGGFSASALRDRIDDAGAKAVITADGGHRGGKTIPLKASTDKALAEGGATVERVIVLERTGEDVPMQAGRDITWADAVADQPAMCDPVSVPAEHPIFILYTSGSTGKPKGVQHASGGYLLGAALTMEWVFDVRPGEDLYWCTADVGWITGHTYVAYGPLAAGATVMIYEGAPTHPHGGRFWEICERHGVTVFYTAPTAIRALRKLGDELPGQYDLSRLRLLGSVGEPINPDAWIWYRDIIGQGRCPVVDTWWQTETGANMIAPLPGATSTKPGSCTLPLPGIDADVVDVNGDTVSDPGQGGYLVIKQPWPFMLRTLWQDQERYIKTYWSTFNNRYYVTGDGAQRDEDGYIWIMGRMDDVLNVSGHRLGTMEIESVLVAHGRVAEAAVVGRPDEVKGEAVVAFVVLTGARPESGSTEALNEELRQWVGEAIGAIAKPAEIRYADNLPKTRSGKIMRRLLREIAKGEEIKQDTSTLENEEIVKQLQGQA